MVIKRDRYSVRCERVIDGDTIMVFWNCPLCSSCAMVRLRLARIDAPELDGANKFEAVRSRTRLAALIEGKEIEIVPCRAWPDKYGRLLSEVIIDGVNVSNWMVEVGAAKWY